MHADEIQKVFFICVYLRLILPHDKIEDRDRAAVWAFSLTLVIQLIFTASSNSPLASDNHWVEASKEAVLSWLTF